MSPTPRLLLSEVNLHCYDVLGCVFQEGVAEGEKCSVPLHFVWRLPGDPERAGYWREEDAEAENPLRALISKNDFRGHSRGRNRFVDDAIGNDVQRLVLRNLRSDTRRHSD